MIEGYITKNIKLRHGIELYINKKEEGQEDNRGA